MYAGNAANQQLGAAIQAKFLNLFSSKRRDADFRYPDGQRRNTPNFVNFFRPFVYRPMIPVKRKSVYGNRIDVIQDTLTLHVQNEVWIDGGYSAEDFNESRIF